MKPVESRHSPQDVAKIADRELDLMTEVSATLEGRPEAVDEVLGDLVARDVGRRGNEEEGLGPPCPLRWTHDGMRPRACSADGEPAVPPGDQGNPRQRED